FDMNKGTAAAELPDAHSRAVHCITQNKGSAFSTQAPDSYNLFLTSAVTDGVKIWDLRMLRCVRRYDNHLNRCHPCSLAISPCGRFIASGSEDNCAYIYDIRSSTYLHKLQKHSDTVLSVAFHPAKPEVRIYLYTSFLFSQLYHAFMPHFTRLNNCCCLCCQYLKTNQLLYCTCRYLPQRILQFKSFGILRKIEEECSSRRQRNSDFTKQVTRSF
uniref:Uncharacterized protein n=1 Tax=Stegastes partitus TaxID=144197 RepID=A0A3B5BLR3_9TELE